MILESFKYSSGNWFLEPLTLGMTNLIVGKNSSGKTRSLDALFEVISLLAQKIDIDRIEECDTELVFRRNEDELKLSIKLSRKEVVREILTVNGEDIIVRNNIRATIYGEEANPPADKLLLHVRRDTSTLPDIEDIIKWSNQTIIRSFIDTSKPSREQLYEIVSSFNDEMKQNVVKMANAVGFPLTRMDTFNNVFDIAPDKAEIKHILFQEEKVLPFLFLDEMSNGMQRTILMFIFIESIIDSGFPALVAIDDLGEGLDYERATKLGKLLFATCEKNNIQFIATTNEEYMMNIVDIDKWNILKRVGHRVKSITSASAPEIFDDFKFSGLDNFDFFTSDAFSRL